MILVTHFVGFYAVAFRRLNVEQATYVALADATDRVLLWLYLNMQCLYILLAISGYMVCRMVVRPSYAGYKRFILARGARIYPPLLFGLKFSVAIYVSSGQPTDRSHGCGEPRSQFIRVAKQRHE